MPGMLSKKNDRGCKGSDVEVAIPIYNRYIHDECYGVQLDAAGNYLLMGGSGDEYDNYSETNGDGWSSDVWVSYLVVLDKQVGVRG